MAGPWYVDDRGDPDGVDGDGLSWAASYRRLSNLLAGETIANGEFIYLGHTHVEDATANVTYNFVNGTEVNPIRVISATVGSGSPVVSEAGANLNADAGAFSITVGTGNTAWFGVTITPGNDFKFPSLNIVHRFENCTSNAADLPLSLGLEATVIWVGGSIISADVSSPNIALSAEAALLCRGVTITMGSAGGSEAIVVGITDATRVLFEDCDFSGCTSTMVLGVFTATNNGMLTYRRCKLPSAYVVPSVTAGNNVLRVESCSGTTSTEPFLGLGGQAARDGGQDNTLGTIKTVTVQKRVGGASDGVNDYSWRMEGATGCSFYSPLESPPITYWAEPGAQTVTIHTAIDSDLDTDELWMVVEYPDDSVTNAEPNHVVLSNTKPDPLETPAAVTRDSGSTWDGAGTGTDGGQGQQKLVSSSFNPTVAGPVIIRVYSGSESTFYIDPKPVVS